MVFMMMVVMVVVMMVVMVVVMMVVMVAVMMVVMVVVMIMVMVSVVVIVAMMIVVIMVTFLSPSISSCASRQPGSTVVVAVGGRGGGRGRVAIGRGRTFAKFSLLVEDTATFGLSFAHEFVVDDIGRPCNARFGL